MSSKPDIIDISSDSSSDESSSSGWANYFPPCASTSSTKKQKKKVEKPLALATILPKELEKAVTSMFKSPIPKRTLPRQKPAKQVIGLPCPKMWNAIQDQARGVHKTMPGYKGKGKEAME